MCLTLRLPGKSSVNGSNSVTSTFHLFRICFRETGEEQVIACASLAVKPWIFIMDTMNGQVREIVSFYLDFSKCNKTEHHGFFY